MKNKNLMIIVLAFVALVGLVTGLWFGLQDKDNPDDKNEINFTVIVVHGDKTERSFQYTAKAGKLGAFLEAEGLIDSEGADAGMFHTVDGEKADWNVNQSYWAFYVDDAYAITGIYDTAIEDGITYKLVYTIG